MAFGAIALCLVAPAAVRGHGGPDLPAPDPLGLLTTWSSDPLVWAGLALAAGTYWLGLRRVDRSHPANRVPRRRLVGWFGGLLVLAVALLSFVDVYATTLFSVHMVQHLLIALVAAPLLAFGAPITLALRAAAPNTRKRVLLPILHSRPVRVLSFPVVAWVLFTAVMWASHFSPLFDAALEDERIHALEHLLYLGTAMLFWWPVVAADPSPWRMPFPARLAYLGLQMPQNTFLGLAIYSASRPLYAHYATLGRAWGPDPLSDQQLAGGIMWAGGDLLFLLPLLLLVGAWLRDEEDKGRLVDERLDRAARSR
jgi:putative membrane protein